MGVEARIQTIDIIVNSVRKWNVAQNRGIPAPTLCLRIVSTFGVRPVTATEYMRTLVDTDRLVMRADGLWSKDVIPVESVSV